VLAVSGALLVGGGVTWFFGSPPFEEGARERKRGAEVGFRGSEVLRGKNAWKSWRLLNRRVSWSLLTALSDAELHGVRHNDRTSR